MMTIVMVRNTSMMAMVMMTSMMILVMITMTLMMTLTKMVANTMEVVGLSGIIIKVTPLRERG